MHQSSRAVNSGAFFDTRQLGRQKMHLTSRAVNSGRGNQALVAPLLLRPCESGPSATFRCENAKTGFLIPPQTTCSTQTTGNTSAPDLVSGKVNTTFHTICHCNNRLADFSPIQTGLTKPCIPTRTGPDYKLYIMLQASTSHHCMLTNTTLHGITVHSTKF